jgi:hypothetical protein
MRTQKLLWRFTLAVIASSALCTSQLSAQCNNTTQPLSDGRLSGTINLNVSGLDQIPTVSGVPSATTQLGNAVNDLNAQLASTANGLGSLNYKFTINGSSGTSEVDMEVETAPGIGAAETTGLPGGGWSTFGDYTININKTAKNGMPFFSTAGVSASTPKGYDTVFYKFAIHEMLHMLGLANTDKSSPPNIMNGVNSTNDANNSLGDASNISNLLTSCVFQQIKAAFFANKFPAPKAGSEEPIPELPGAPVGGYTSPYNCFTYSWDEWNASTNTLTGYSETICD